MSVKRISIVLFFGCLLASAVGYGQEDTEPFTCFNAFEVHYPLGKNDFARTEIALDDREINAVYYLYQDKYTFWYKFIAHESVTIDFSVTPSNEKDRYRAVVFKYGGDDFCDKYVNQAIDPVDVRRSPIFEGQRRITYRNTLEAAKGDTFYVAVLSLNPDDCGHRFYTESGRRSMSLHAVHQPCYNFVFLDAPDFTQARMELPDVDLELDFGIDTDEEEAAVDSMETPPEVEPEKASAFEGIETIEVESEDDNMVSVGDRLILNEVYFYNNTYAFKPGAENELDQLVRFLNLNPTLEIEIQGHSANDTEEIRPDPNFKGQGKAWNFKGSAFELSEKRAEAVRDYLISRGIGKKRLTAKGYGDTQKRVPDAKTFEEFEKNMRVEALVIKE